MDATERPHLLDAYFRNMKYPSDATYWAWNRIHDEVHRGSNLAWTLILEALERDLDDLEFDYLAAGSLENLVYYHCERFIERIEIEAAHNEKFQDLLLGVDISDEDIGEDLLRRFAKAADVNIEEYLSSD